MSLPIFNQAYVIDFHPTDFWGFKTTLKRVCRTIANSAGLKAGTEAAIHSMRLIFEDSSNEAVILVDAKNLFNSYNRKVALHNIQVTCLRSAKSL